MLSPIQSKFFIYSLRSENWKGRKLERGTGEKCITKGYSTRGKKGQ